MTLHAHAVAVSDHRRVLASVKVFGLRHRVKVGWIHAAMRSAEMVEHQSVRDGSDEVLVGDSMRQPRAELVALQNVDARVPATVWRH